MQALFTYPVLASCILGTFSLSQELECEYYREERRLKAKEVGLIITKWTQYLESHKGDMKTPWPLDTKHKPHPQQN